MHAQYADIQILHNSGKSIFMMCLFNWKDSVRGGVYQKDKAAHPKTFVHCTEI